jgi:predicted CXXCH cytochrome family protein
VALPLLIAAAGGIGLLAYEHRPGHGRPDPGLDTPLAAAFVGREACATCHADEARRWAGSHHDLAMQVAHEQSVLGAFDGSLVTHDGVTSRFYRRDGKYLLWTDGPDGTMQEYEVAYTFGVDPLQQYLIALPGGRYQALDIAWDARPPARGGQRWFHLHPDEHVGPGDVLHWTGPALNWNDRCARCHSTNVHKGYRAAEGRYETTWSEVNVSCEACHGPGSTHVAWARGDRSRDAVRKGLTVDLVDRPPASWIFGGPSGIAHRSVPRVGHTEIDTCAPCHARRAELSDGALPGRPLLDDYVPALLEEDLYFPDGQIEDEVYEYGSFLQSRMYRAGVTCSDCHDPHSLRLRAEGNALCTRCHAPERFDTAEHYFHPADSRGAQCVACHMPARTYMVVHERRDHGFRVPRPELATKLGTPDVCAGCHADRTPAWAADAIAHRPGVHRAGTPHYGEALWSGRHGAADAVRALVDLTQDADAPELASATAVELLRGEPAPFAREAIRNAAGAADPLLRLAAMRAIEDGDPREVVAIGSPRLADPLRAVRLAAVQAVAAIPPTQLSLAQHGDLERAIEEYHAAELANADRPESQANLGILAIKLGRPAEAEQAFQAAIRLRPQFVPAYVNLADLYRSEQRDADGEPLLRKAIGLVPGSAEAHHALGLLLVRQRRLPEALPELDQAARLEPGHVRYAYVLGVALHSTGDTRRALDLLRAAHDRSPGDRDVLLALATISRDAGALDAARGYADALVALAPWDPGARGLREELEGK